MVKPDWCPQRVWDEAYAQAEELTFEQSPAEFLETVEIIARAILAAEKREREACARLARRQWKKSSLGWNEQAVYASEIVSKETAQAIRNRNGE